MRKNVELMNGKDLMKVDTVMLNKFVNKCAPIWNPVFKAEFEKDGFDILEYAKEMSSILDELRYQYTLKKLDGYNLEEELNDFIENEDLSEYESNDILKGCMYLMATQQLMMESVLNKTNINDEMFMFNLIKGFIFSMNDLDMENVLDLSFIPISNTLKMTLETLVSDEDRKYVRF